MGSLDVGMDPVDMLVVTPMEASASTDLSAGLGHPADMNSVGVKDAKG